MSKKKPSYIDFDHAKYKKLLASKYIIKGEIGVLSYPYSKQIHKYWRFKTPDLALKSAKKIYNIFLQNLNSKRSWSNKFVRADICRKFLQMGYTRSMRYYYHKSGKKWKKIGNSWKILPYDYDPVKKISANIFKKYLNKALKNKNYRKLRKKFTG